MLRNLIVALLLACAGLNVHASEQTWQFKYTGFLFSPPIGGGPSQFLPDHILIGTFTGNDLDHDDILEKSELSAFLLDNTIDYVALCPGSGMVSCAINSFSFNTSTQVLSFRTTWEQDGEFISNYRYVSSDSGDMVWVLGYGYDIQQLYRIVPETTLVLTNLTAPIPEPGTYAMLASGLGVLVLLRRRPRRGQRVKRSRWRGRRW